ncbi:hypothetical protein GY45DRAFT_847976 [Cubamyces sp. BRFM 1775]|nr:hypothetical protein GY45DRAFT_847976 [Cubamyces sp. BRFM 1775]
MARAILAGCVAISTTAALFGLVAYQLYQTYQKSPPPPRSAGKPLKPGLQQGGNRVSVAQAREKSDKTRVRRPPHDEKDEAAPALRPASRAEVTPPSAPTQAHARQRLPPQGSSPATLCGTVPCTIKGRSGNASNAGGCTAVIGPRADPGTWVDPPSPAHIHTTSTSGTKLSETPSYVPQISTSGSSPSARAGDAQATSGSPSPLYPQDRPASTPHASTVSTASPSTSAQIVMPVRPQSPAIALQSELYTDGAPNGTTPIPQLPGTITTGVHAGSSSELSRPSPYIAELQTSMDNAAALASDRRNDERTPVVESKPKDADRQLERPIPFMLGNDIGSSMSVGSGLSSNSHLALSSAVHGTCRINAGARDPYDTNASDLCTATDHHAASSPSSDLRAIRSDDFQPTPIALIPAQVTTPEVDLLSPLNSIPESLRTSLSPITEQDESELLSSPKIPSSELSTAITMDLSLPPTPVASEPPSTAQSDSPRDGSSPQSHDARSLHIWTDERIEYWLPPASSARFLQFRFPMGAPSATSESDEPQPDADQAESSSSCASPSIYGTPLGSPMSSARNPRSPASAPKTVPLPSRVGSTVGPDEDLGVLSPCDEFFSPISPSSDAYQDAPYHDRS